jgi:hypothetical protein
MFAVVTDGSITSFPKGNKGITIGDNQYPAAIYTLWTEAERNAIGIYTVEIDNTNKKDEEWYINTNQSYAFGSGKVTATYGTATARAIADVSEVWTQADIDAGRAPDGTSANDPMNDSDGNQIITRGLKYIKNQIIDNQCAGLLAPSDWRVVREQETGSAMDSDWKTWRAAVRTKCNSMQTQITNAANVDALAALFTYTEQEDGSVTRPLGEWPVKS